MIMYEYIKGNDVTMSSNIKSTSIYHYGVIELPNNHPGYCLYRIGKHYY